MEIGDEGGDPLGRRIDGEASLDDDVVGHEGNLTGGPGLRCDWRVLLATMPAGGMMASGDPRSPDPPGTSPGPGADELLDTAQEQATN